ncbi:polyketide synthase [Mycolicibacterium wolinskyi]|uniref:polyketide synthase n=1 Tax=Mycolicibacterium wolinskyi TaxID=59750 RepID=UPI003917A5D6
MAAPLLTGASGVTCWIADHATATPPRPVDLSTTSNVLDSVLAAELHGARAAMGCAAEDILVAALGRTVARVIGDGILVVDVDTHDGASRRVAVPCVSQRGLSGSELLATARSATTGTAPIGAAVRIGYGEGVFAEPGEYLLELRVHPGPAGGLTVDWSFDVRSFDAYTVEELAEQFPSALIEVTSG